MSNIKKLFTRTMVRGIAVFAVSAIVLQSLAMLFMTEGGLSFLAPYMIGIRSEKLESGDNQFGKMFALNSEVKDAGLVILAIDEGVGDSYVLASDYLRFLCRLSGVSCVAAYIPQMKLRTASEASVKGDYEDFSAACANLRKSKSLPEQFIKYLESVYSQNARLNPDEKIPMVGIKGYDDYKDLISALTSDLFSTGTGLYGDHMEIMDAASPEEYIELVRKHETSLSEVLGSRFSVYAETLDDVLAGTVETEFAFRNLVKYAPAGEGTVFAVIPRELLGEDSDFVSRAAEVYGKVTVTNTVYYDCETVSDGEEKILNDGKYPNVFGGIRIVGAHDFKDFREYYSKVSGGSTEGIGNLGESTFFVISGSGAVTYGEENSGEVLVAPGA